MNKARFMKKMSFMLHRIPTCERQKILAFYEEMLKDNIEGGVPEEKAVNQLGSINSLISKILLEFDVQKLIAKYEKKANNTKNNIPLCVMNVIIKVVKSICKDVLIGITYLIGIILGFATLFLLIGSISLVTLNIIVAVFMLGMGMIIGTVAVIALPWLGRIITLIRLYFSYTPNNYYN